MKLPGTMLPAMLALLAGCTLAAQNVKIGVLAPLTGFAAADGQEIQNVLKLAVENINQKGGLLGRQVELVIYDDRADPKEAVALARKLIEQDQIKAFVAGSYSMPSRAVAPMFQEEKIPLVAAYAVHPDVTGAGNYCFRNGFLGPVEGRSAAYTCVKLLKGKRIALLTSDNDFGRTMAVGFKDYMKNSAGGAQLVSEQVYPMSEKDFNPYLAKIKEAKPDVVFSGGYYFQTGPMIKQARDMGLTARFVGEEGSDSQEFINIGGKSAEGFVLVTNLNRDDKRAEVQSILKQYHARYNASLDMTSASAYDAFMIICNGILTAKSTDGPAVRQAIADTRKYNGLTGMIQGFAKGEVVKDVQVQIVKNGQFRYFGVVTDPALITP